MTIMAMDIAGELLVLSIRLAGQFAKRKRSCLLFGHFTIGIERLKNVCPHMLFAGQVGGHSLHYWHVSFEMLSM